MNLASVPVPEIWPKFIMFIALKSFQVTFCGLENAAGRRTCPGSKSRTD